MLVFAVSKSRNEFNAGKFSIFDAFSAFSKTFKAPLN